MNDHVQGKWMNPVFLELTAFWLNIGSDVDLKSAILTFNGTIFEINSICA